MKRSITRWTTAVAAVALLALPATGWAQAGTTAQPPATSSPQQPASPQSGTPQEHLAKAKTSLNAIDAAKLTGKAKTQVAELKRHLSALERASSSKDQATAASAAARTTASAKWSTEVAAIDKILGGLLDQNAGVAGTTGTTGTAGAAKSAVTLDEATRSSLMEVRQHVTNFAAAMSGTGSSPSTSASNPASATDPASAASSTSATSSTGSTSSTATTSSTTAATGSTAQPPAGATAGQPQVDAEAARRHLTEARNTLAELTQLPAAAQLSGEARTQVSQLIANFNELITTDTEWRASYAKVEANLTALIGPNDPTQTGAATSATTGTTGTTGSTSATAGTSGTTSAATSLDPTVKAKLIELRAKLNEFERAAGGDAAAANPSSAASSTMTGTTGTMTGTTGSTTSTTQPPQNPEAGAPAAEDQGHAEAMRHLQAIEAILGVSTSTTGTAGTTGTSGTTGTAATTSPVTLDQAKLDQLKTHLSELKRLLNQAERK